MSEPSRSIAILGSTGSIGKSTLEVVRESRGCFKVLALTANKHLALLCEQAAEFQAPWVVATDAAEAQRFDWSALPKSSKLLIGPEGVQQVASAAEVDIVVAAVVGSAGLTGTWAALE